MLEGLYGNGRHGQRSRLRDWRAVQLHNNEMNDEMASGRASRCADMFPHDVRDARGIDRAAEVIALAIKIPG
jgi:hypothetical protein